MPITLSSPLREGGSHLIRIILPILQMEKQMLAEVLEVLEFSKPLSLLCLLCCFTSGTDDTKSYFYPLPSGGILH
jgi:hypothetical protein